LTFYRRLPVRVVLAGLTSVKRHRMEVRMFNLTGHYAYV